MNVQFLAILALTAVCLLASAAWAGEFLWLEAERFDDLGGWVNDPQFIDQMGSPYLLANGRGEPLADAIASRAVARPGRYRLWARTKDWLPEHHPGRFRVVLNGKACEHVFGEAGKPGWGWEDGGVHELPAKVELRLRDLTGTYGRCDAVVLASDLEWKPPTGTDEIARLREAHGGVSRQERAMPAHDVVVIGGGLAGCTAAVAAARNGASVALIQNRPLLGGNASTEILVPPVGVWPHRKADPRDPRETGLVEEYRTAGNQKVHEGKLYSERLLRLVKLDPNLDLHLDTHATGVEMAPGPNARIAAVLAVDVRTGQRMRFEGQCFIDCTGDAVVGVAAGAECRHGKEPQSMYDEPWAPEKPSPHTMGNGLKYFHRDTGEPQPFTAPPWAYRFEKCEDFRPGRHPQFITSEEIQGQWMIELGGLRDTYADAEEIRDDLLRLILGLWDHTKNRCPRDREKATTHRLVWLGHVAGKRENRRLIGDHVLTQNDIGRQTQFPDRVAFGAWSVDDHYSAGFFHKGPTGMHMDRSQHHYMGVPFSIPFRCLYSRNVENLMMAGRNISASHLGMSNTRVMLTCAVMGHAVGTAAAMCAQRGTDPRGLYRQHIGDLQQQLLKEGAHLIGIPGRDPRDLARKARVTASSERRGPDEPMPAANVVNGFARLDGGKANAWAPDPAAPGPHWVELAWEAPVAFNVVHVAFQTARMAPKEFVLEAWLDGTWKPLVSVTDNRHRRHVLGLERVTTARLRVVLAQPAGLCEVRVYDEPQRVVEIARRAHENMRLPDKGPFLPWAQGTDARKLEGIVLDAAEAEHSGEWTSSTWSQPYVGDGYLHDGNTEKGAKTVRFGPKLAPPGRYEVRMAYVAYKNRATNTPVTIRAADGEKTMQINQQTRPPIDGLFRSLGTFEMDGKSTILVGNAGTDGYVVVDAIQLIPRGPAGGRTEE